jgi:hypothetical protein
MSKVFVLDTNFMPLNPIHSAQARQLLRNKKAAIFRQFPFTIILKKSRPDSPVSSLRLHINPGAKFIPPITKLSTVLVGVSWRFR